jgi:hypothetical protein
MIKLLEVNLFMFDGWPTMGSLFFFGPKDHWMKLAIKIANKIVK